MFSTRIQDHINHGNAVAAAKLGIPWDLYRNGALIRTNLKAYISPQHKFPDVEFAQGSFVYEGILSRKVKLDTGVFNFLQPGDQLQGKMGGSRDEETTTTERYTVVGLRLLHTNILVRTDEVCNVFRPQMNIPTGIQPPTYNYEFLTTALQLGFNPTTGVWAFESQPLAGNRVQNIYCGLTKIGAGSYDPGYANPMATPATGWLASCQLFYDGSGAVVEILEEDIIVDPSLNVYRVERNYWQNEAAFINQAFCTRLIR